jgi:glycosyltransferase involved in cell wall biosynthesis
MKIAFVTPYYVPELKFGGPPKRLHTLARGLAEAGHEINVSTFDSTRRSRRDLIMIDGVRVQYIPWRGIFRYALPKEVTLVRQQVQRAEIIHCYGLYSLLGLLAAQYASHFGIPFLLEPMGMFVPRARSLIAKRIYNATFTKWMAKRASAIIATSDIEAEELKPLRAMANVFVRRNGIDLAEFRSLPDRAIMRSRWNIAPNDQLVLYIGRISAKKNLCELVSAFVAAAVRSSKLVIAGPISEPAYYRQLTQEVATDVRRHDIRIEGPVYGEELKAALAAADLFVLPSLNENFGNAAGEAVAANVPVLVTDTCGIAPMIHGRAGLAVPLGINFLAEGLRIMLDPNQRQRFVARAEEVKRELSWDEPIEQTEALYMKIVRSSETRKS